MGNENNRNSIDNIMVVGVGGQGTLLTSRILGRLFLGGGYDVKVSEVHGMSQRGGSVVTYVRRGKSVASPLICEGEAQLILAFEELEAARYLPYLEHGGTLIVSKQQILPMSALAQERAYPGDILSRVEKTGAVLYEIDARKAALEAGSVKAVNMILLGVLSRILTEFSVDEWKTVISQTTPPAFLQINLDAFDAGRRLFPE